MVQKSRLAIVYSQSDRVRSLNDVNERINSQRAVAIHRLGLGLGLGLGCICLDRWLSSETVYLPKGSYPSRY